MASIPLAEDASRPQKVAVDEGEFWWPKERPLVATKWEDSRLVGGEKMRE